MVKSLEACSNSNRFLYLCAYFSFFFFCVCLLQTGTKCREFIWSSVPFNDASGPSFKHTPTTNSAAQVISTQKAEPKKYWKRVGFRNLTFCVDITNDSDWNCGCSKEELAFSSHLRHLESQLECYNLQRQNYLGDRHRNYPSKSSQ